MIGMKKIDFTKRYMLFSNHRDFENAGGMNDFIGSFDTIEECEDNIMSRSYNDWFHVYDTVDGKKVINIKKENKVDKIDYSCDWFFGCSISSIKGDIIKLEELGATHIDIGIQKAFGGAHNLYIKPERRRLETDEELEDRIMCKNERLKKKFNNLHGRLGRLGRGEF